MSDFKIKFKLTGLEIEIEGSREDLPLITQKVAEQFGSLLEPAASIVEGEVFSSAPPSAPAQRIAAPASPQASTSSRRKSKSKPSNATAATIASIHAPLNWRHDASKYGHPKQEWTAADKFIWIMYVVKELFENQELTAMGLANTFNSQFKQAGLINVKNSVRDIGVVKGKSNPPMIGEDTTKNPSTWFLTEFGIKEAQKLISQTLSK